MIAGGIIQEISFNNPDVGTGFFYGVEGETGTYVLGGLLNASDPDIDGSFTLVVEKKIVPGSIDMTVSNDMSADNPAFENAYALSKSNNETTWTFSNTNGEIYTGTGIIVDTPSLDGNKSRFSLMVRSGKGFVKQ